MLYFFKKEYRKSYDDVQKVQKLNGKVEPRLIKWFEDNKVETLSE